MLLILAVKILAVKPSASQKVRPTKLNPEALVVAFTADWKRNAVFSSTDFDENVPKGVLSLDSVGQTDTGSGLLDVTRGGPRIRPERNHEHVRWTEHSRESLQPD